MNERLARPGIVWTRELMLERAGYRVVVDLRAALSQSRGALKAVMPTKRRRVRKADGSVEETVEQGGAPDWQARLRAAEQLYAIAGVVRRPTDAPDTPDPTRPVAVTIVLSANGNGHAGAPLPTHGVRLHLNGDSGHGA